MIEVQLNPRRAYSHISNVHIACPFSAPA